MASDGQTPTPTRGIPVDLGDGKPYFLRYSLAARKRLIAQLGGEEKLKNLSGDELGVVVLEGLKGSAPDLTLEQLEELIDMQNINGVVEAMAKAIGMTGKAAVSGEASPAPAAAAGVGSASS